MLESKSKQWHDIYHANLASALLTGERELINHTFTIDDPTDNLITSKARADRVEFFDVMFNWMLSGETTVTKEMLNLNPNAKNYPTVFDSPELQNHSVAYGARIVEQLPYVLEILHKNPDSRRACIQILNSDDRHVGMALELGDTKCEYVCTTGFNFRIREGKLDMIAQVRSNNYVTTVTQDVYMFTKFQQYVAEELNCAVGKYYHNTMSGHILSYDTLRTFAILKEYVDSTELSYGGWHKVSEMVCGYKTRFYHD